MLTREDIFKLVKENYETLPDYPFKRFPNYAALRHKSNGKWYGLVMNVSLEQLGLEENKEVRYLEFKMSSRSKWFFKEWEGYFTCISYG